MRGPLGSFSPPWLLFGWVGEACRINARQGDTGSLADPGVAIVLRLLAPRERPRILFFRLSRSFVPKRLGFSEDRRELGLLAPATD